MSLAAFLRATTGRPIALTAVLVVFCCHAQLSICHAQPSTQDQSQVPRLTLSVAAAASRPAESAFRQIYGNAAFPVIVQAEYRVAPRVVVFAGVRAQRSNGHTFISGEVIEEERFPVEFGMYSIRVGGMLAFPRGRWQLLLGGGPTYSVYREEWTTMGIETRDRQLGLLIGAGAACAVTRVLFLTGRLEYAAVPAGRGPQAGDSMNLGGLDLAVGVGFRF